MAGPSTAFITIKPEDRYAFAVFKVIEELGYYTDHEDRLERVNNLAALLWPAINDDESTYLDRNKELVRRYNKEGRTPNPYGLANARLKLLMLEVQRVGLIGGKGAVRFKSRKQRAKKTKEE